MKRCFVFALTFYSLCGCDFRPDQEKIQGEWRFHEMLGVYEFELPATKGGPDTLTFSGNTFTYTNDAEDPRHTVSGTFTCDPTKRPRQLTFTFNGRTVVAIYSVSGTTLRLCIGAKDGVPPETFEGGPGERPALLTFTRPR